jgi:surface polysaccharide O-acyltransferase-like enzyme
MGQASRSAHPHQPGLDLLRGLCTLLVVLHHAAITYGAIGGWYYREVATSPRLDVQLLVFFCTVNQTWFMGLFFLLAGYFTPPALARKGVADFVRGRLLRLGVPLLVYGTLIGPATIALAATARGKPWGDTFLTLLQHNTFENGPLWFAQALLLMTGATLVWWWARGRLPKPAAVQPALWQADHRPWPCRRTLLLAALATGAAAWLLRQAWPVGRNVWGLQLGYFASYGVLFGVGCRAARSGWLERLPGAEVRFWWHLSLCCLPVLPVLYGLGARWPEMRSAILPVAYAFWEPLMAWGMLLRLLQAFGPQWRTSSTRQPWQTALSRRAFAIYVIHPPVLVAVALAGSGVSAAPLLKWTVTGSLSCLLCFVLAGWLLRVRGVARVL